MKRWLLCTVILILAAALTACGSASAPEEAAPEPAAEEAEAAPESDDDGEMMASEGESPMLAEMVAAGELPPVDERLPVDPLVLELPWASIGQYGGTMKRATTDSDMSDVSMYMYGHSATHWAEGGTAVQPGLAKGWETNEDASEWTFFFREGTKWSDGEPFTVDDVIFWWEDMALNPDHPEPIPAWALAGGAPMETEKVDDYTLRFKFAGPAPLTDFELASFPNGGNGPGFGPYPRHYLEQFHPNYSDAADYEEFTEKEDWWVNPERPVLNAWMPIEFEPGDRMILERNPYYYVVDQAGNQLPYIDRFEVRLTENVEALKLQIINGDVNVHAYPNLSLRDLALLKENEEKGNYRVLLWDNGAGGAPAWGINWNNPDDEKREVVRTVQYRRALSHAMDRERIRKVTWLGMGQEASTGTMSPNAAQFNRTEEGKAILQEWRESAVAFDPEMAMSMLDEINVVDQDDDGFRDLPSGAALEVRIDFPSGAAAFLEAAQLMAEDWQNVGLNAFVNSIPGSEIGVMTREATYDIRLYGGGAPDGPDLLIYPAWLVSYGSGGRWAPLYGAWMAVEGTDKEGTELDKDPRDRTPPREEIPADDPNFRMWELYKQAIVEPDQDKRDALVFDILRIHIDEGPFLLGGIADPPNIFLAGANLLNVPTRDDIPLGGWYGPGVLAMPGAMAYPEAWYLEE
ncbi:MAG: ABC transporter substrate-binding protein [Chloroflexota bacterium]